MLWGNPWSWPGVFGGLWLLLVAGLVFLSTWGWSWGTPGPGLMVLSDCGCSRSTPGAEEHFGVTVAAPGKL